jgi:hypothetical protein
MQIIDPTIRWERAHKKQGKETLNLNVAEMLTVEEQI